MFLVWIQWILQQNTAGLNAAMNQQQEHHKKDDHVSSKEISWETLDKCVERLLLLLYSELGFVTVWMKQWQNIMQFNCRGTSQDVSEECEDSKVKSSPLRADIAVSSADW